MVGKVRGDGWLWQEQPSAKTLVGRRNDSVRQAARRGEWERRQVGIAFLRSSGFDNDSVHCHIMTVADTYTLSELVETVNQWCETHAVSPASNQAGERLTERNVRFYRTIGLLDAPGSGAGAGYNEKHKLQLIAVRLLQSEGLALRRIRELLLGRSLADLRRIEKKGTVAGKSKAPPLISEPAGEDWRIMPLDEEFLLISRRPRVVPREVLDQIRALLRSPFMNRKDAHATTPTLE